MIYYDSHQWRTLARIRGSVLPMAMIWAVPSTLLALALKWLDSEGYLVLDDFSLLTQESVYGGFTYALGFSVVFRTTQSYKRYWTAATSVHEMSSEWSDSCASLMAFCTISKAPYRETMRFRHTVIRLFSLLHAMALQEVASVSGIDLPLLDVDAFSKDDLRVLTSGLAQGRKVQVVLSWIKAYITHSMNEGILNVPPPILTRVFQELGAGLVNYHKTQNIVIWPFPFPYTQLNLTLLYVYMLLTPVVLAKWEAHIGLCLGFTFASVTCMMALDLIASELENPFGDDANDLPVLEMQKEMNKVLTMQLNPMTWRAPDLLLGSAQEHHTLLKHFSNVLPTMSSSSRKLQSQLRWSGQAAVDSEVKRLQTWLKCLPMGSEELHKMHPVPENKAQQESEFLLEGTLPPELKSEEPPSPQVTPKVRSEEPRSPIHQPKAGGNGHSSTASLAPASASVTAASVTAASVTGASVASSSIEVGTLHRCPPIEETPFGEFLEALHNELQEHMQKLLEMQGRELETLERLLTSLRPLGDFPRTSSRGSDSELEEAATDKEQVEHPPLPPKEPLVWQAQRPTLMIGRRGVA